MGIPQPAPASEPRVGTTVHDRVPAPKSLARRACPEHAGRPGASGPDPVPHLSPSGASMSQSYAVEARGLVKRYGSTTAAGGIDFEVPTGTVTAVLGPNGAGKTTTVRMLT